MAEMNEQGQKPKRGCGEIALIVGAVFAGFWVLGSVLPESKRGGSSGADERDMSIPTVEVTAQQLWQAFDANEVAAMRSYGDRRLRVTGTVDSVTLDFADDPVVMLATGQMFRNVHAGFDKENGAATAALAKGQSVTVECESVSEVAGTPMLRDCLIPPAP